MTKHEVFEVVRRSIIEVLPDLPSDVISSERKLSDLGANSVDRVEVLTLSMEGLQVKIPLMSFADASSIGELVDVLFSNRR